MFDENGNFLIGRLINSRIDGGFFSKAFLFCPYLSLYISPDVYKSLIIKSSLNCWNNLCNDCD